GNAHRVVVPSARRPGRPTRDSPADGRGNTKAPVHCWTGASELSVSETLGHPVLGIDRRRNSRRPLRGRHLHRTPPTTVQWITPCSGLTAGEGPIPPDRFGRPSLVRSRALRCARVN